MQDRSTDFEFLPIDVSLGRCMRYYETIINDGSGVTIGLGGYYATNNLYFPLRYRVQKRASPSLEQVTGTNYYNRYSNNGADGFDSFSTARVSKNAISLFNDSQTTGIVGYIAEITADNASAFLALSAEL